MNCRTKLRINHLTAVKSVAILENRGSEKASLVFKYEFCQAMFISYAWTVALRWFRVMLGSPATQKARPKGQEEIRVISTESLLDPQTRKEHPHTLTNVLP
ncbi:hypothetical protein TNCV_4736951 [Trichonephila clavipes]|nr:hypothetical protein TNCV_4736951 [Trichonephila clavipes]